ncbi:MAG: hypothetical protein EGQ87_09370 [Clostridiales bacterium]|nr:hypothetical protein [Clostridiales bacterium]
MRKIMKRGFCLFLVAVLLAGLVPCAFADEAKTSEEVESSEAAREAAEETTAPPETAVPSETTEPPSETTEPPEATETTESETEVTEPEADPVEDAPEDVVEDERLAAYASTVTNVLLFDKASPNYTTVLRSQVSVTYNPNGSDAAKTAYIKNLGWHFARYNNVPYEDDPLYCIEPCKNYAASTSGNYMDEDLGVSGSSSTRGSNVWYAMPYSYRQAIALTLLYSRQLWDSNYSVKTTAMANNPNVSTRIATQFLIYEIVTGLRDADTFNRRGSNGYTSGDVFYNAGVASVSGFAEKYNSIVSSVQNAMKIPSFTSRSSGSAPTITMSGSQVSVTDSNGVLGNFSFTNGNGASFSKSGNTLTITKTGSISPTALFSATRSLPSAENSTVSIYYSASSTYQTCVKLYSPQVDTLRAYFRINAPDPGAIALVKTTEDGQNLSGWRFGVYSNAACTTLVSGPHTTDTSGRISIPGLNAGTYYIKELGHTNSAISSRYTCSGENPKMLSISNGTTTSVNFYNKLTVGALEIRKSTNTGNHLGGWKFIVKKDGAEIPGSPFTTDTTGRIHISNLIPGKYLVMESPTEDPYWSVELGFHTVTVEYGKNAVDQWLNKEQGLGYFTKSTNTGDEISGWHITVYTDEACTQELRTLITGQDGTVGIYLEPGTYWVKETGSEEVRDDYWKMDDSVKKLVIHAHEKTTLEFINNYSGRISIQKSVEPEGTVEGWRFKITDGEGKEVSGSPFATDKNGKILTGNLAPGDYTVEEVLSADSLYTGEAPKTVTVTAGKTAEVSFLNKLRTGKITIRKVDTKDEPLAGATFLLEGSEDGSLWYPVIPGSNGICVLGEPSEENLAAASKTSGEDGLLTWKALPITLQYRITETNAPDGYTLLKDYAFAGTLPADNTEMELRVVNGEAFALPKTGSTGFVRIPMATVFCLMLCAANLWLLRKKEQ